MKQATYQNLNKLNQDFYARIGQYWNNNIDYVWAGWLELTAKGYFDSKDTQTIIDLGCGNGRFTHYWRNFIGKEEQIIGIDFEDWIVPEIRQTYTQDTFVVADVTAAEWATKYYNTVDLVVAFGLFHHIPSFAVRKRVIDTIYSVLKPGGTCIFTIWNFDKLPRLQKRVLPKDSVRYQHVLSTYNIDPDDLEEGDAILDWVKKDISYRYSHTFSESEISDLTEKFTLLDRFDADDRENNRNTYFVLQKAA